MCIRDRWLIESLCFEKACLDDLDANIRTQIGGYVPVMSAPELAKELLIQYISDVYKRQMLISRKQEKPSKGISTPITLKDAISQFGTNGLPRYTIR